MTAELAVWLPLVKKGGVIAFDDIHMNDMDAFWDAFDLPKVDTGTALHWSGFGVAVRLDPDQSLRHPTVTAIDFVGEVKCAEAPVSHVVVACRLQEL